MENNQNISYCFSFNLKIYPISFLERCDLEKGDKILLPPSVLQKLSISDIEGPITFEVTSLNSKRRSHCGVMDFTADEGCAYLPRWMINNLDSQEGEKLQFTYSCLEKGNYVKLQPQTDDFLRITNPKAVLEAKLRYFTCLTKSDSIAIEYNDKIYWINVLEVKPGVAVSIIDTDIEVDFAPPIVKKEFKSQENVEKMVTTNNEVPPDFEESSTEESEIKKKTFKGKGQVAK
jgi:ubiquitin fusion degradation protein 1